MKSSHCGEDEDGGLEDDNFGNDQDDENGDFEDDKGDGGNGDDGKVGNLRRFRCLDHCVALICQSRGDIPRRWAMIASMPKTP